MVTRRHVKDDSVNGVRRIQRKALDAREVTQALPILAGLVGALILLTGDWWARAGLWAFDFLRYIGWPWRIVMAVLVFSTGIPSVYALVAQLWQRRPALPGWPLMPFGALLFWLLREQTWRGDALLKVHLLETQTLAGDPYVWKEPLDAFLAYMLTGLLRPMRLGPEVAVAALSVMAGVIYIIAILEASRHLALDATGRALGFIGLAALGSSQLWFGHIENYSLVTALSVLAVAMALGYLAGKRPLWAVGLATGAAVSFHPQAVFAMPALLVLFRRRDGLRQLLTLVGAVVILPLLTVAALLVSGARLPVLGYGYAGDSQLFWPPSQALAPGHLLDALSNLWLVAPLLPGLLGAGLLALFRPAAQFLMSARLPPREAKTDRGQVSKGSLRSPVFIRVPLPGQRERCFVYLSVLALGLLVYHFTFQNDLPRPQDWDLYAMVGPGVTLWGLCAWLRIANGGRQGGASIGRRVLLPALAFAVCLTTGWVGVNHAYTLVRPDANQRELYARYRLVDLVTILPQATVTPAEPFCSDPAADPTGCRRVTEASFTMPQDGDLRPVIFAHAPAQIAFPLDVPAGASFLWLSPALDPLAWGWGGDGVTFQVRIRHASGDDLLWERRLTPANQADLDWGEVFVPLDDYARQSVTLLLVTTPGPAGDNAADRAGWGLPWLMRGAVDG